MSTFRGRNSFLVMNLEEVQELSLNSAIEILCFMWRLF